MTAYTSLAFGIVGFLACLCCRDVDDKMNNKVSRIILSTVLQMLTMIQKIEVYLENTELADRNKYH